MNNEVTAKRLQKALADAGINQQELADRSGVSKASISQYVNGSHAPGNISAAKMGKVLKVEKLWLMGFEVEMKKEISSESADCDMILLEKFSLLNKRDKQIVMSIIEFMLSIKTSGAN